MFRKIEGGLNKESATRKREDGISEQRLLEFAMQALKIEEFSTARSDNIKDASAERGAVKPHAIVADLRSLK